MATDLDTSLGSHFGSKIISSLSSSGVLRVRPSIHPLPAAMEGSSSSTPEHLLWENDSAVEVPHNDPSLSVNLANCCNISSHFYPSGSMFMALRRLKRLLARTETQLHEHNTSQRFTVQHIKKLSLGDNIHLSNIKTTSQRPCCYDDDDDVCKRISRNAATTTKVLLFLWLIILKSIKKLTS